MSKRFIKPFLGDTKNLITFLCITNFSYSIFTMHIGSMLIFILVFLETKKLLIHLLITLLTLKWRRSLSYRNQSIDLQSRSKDWFLYDNSLRHKRVKGKRCSYYLSSTFVKHMWRVYVLVKLQAASFPQQCKNQHRNKYFSKISRIYLDFKQFSLVNNISGKFLNGRFRKFSDLFSVTKFSCSDYRVIILNFSIITVMFWLNMRKLVMRNSTEHFSDVLDDLNRWFSTG